MRHHTGLKTVGFEANIGVPSTASEEGKTSLREGRLVNLNDIEHVYLGSGLG